MTFIWHLCLNLSLPIKIAIFSKAALLDSAFHSSEVDKMSTRNFWELNGKK